MVLKLGHVNPKRVSQIQRLLITHLAYVEWFYVIHLVFIVVKSMLVIEGVICVWWEQKDTWHLVLIKFSLKLFSFTVTLFGQVYIFVLHPLCFSTFNLKLFNGHYLIL